MKILSSFLSTTKLLMGNIWPFHTRWRNYCQKLGKNQLLFPLLRYLEPEMDHDRTFENFDPKDVILISPSDSKDYIIVVIDRYNSLTILLGVSLGVFVSLIIWVAYFPVAYLVSITGSFSSLILFLLLWPLFMLFFGIYAFVAPMRERKAMWYFEYALIEYGISRENKVERLIAALEQEVDKPSERVEHLRELSRKRNQELKLLINDLAKTKKKAKQYQELMKNNREIIFDILHTKQAIETVERESIEKLLKPKGILRDISINLVANLIWTGLGFLAGLSFGTRN